MPIQDATANTETRLDTVIRCLSLGMTIREACERAGQDYGSMRTRLYRGRNSKAQSQTSDRRLYLRVLEAQGRFRESVYASLLKAAKDGNASAAASLMERVERMGLEREVEEVPDDPLAAARYRLNEIRVRIRESSGIAYTKMVEREAALLEEIKRLTAQAERDPRTMTPEEWRAYLTRDAETSPDSDLEVYVAEYQRRHGLVLVGRSAG